MSFITEPPCEHPLTYAKDLCWGGGPKYSQDGEWSSETRIRGLELAAPPTNLQESVLEDKKDLYILLDIEVCKNSWKGDVRSLQVCKHAWRGAHLSSMRTNLLHWGPYCTSPMSPPRATIGHRDTFWVPLCTSSASKHISLSSVSHPGKTIQQEEGSGDLLIYSQSLWSTGDNLDLRLASERHSPVGSGKIFS